MKYARSRLISPAALQNVSPAGAARGKALEPCMPVLTDRVLSGLVMAAIDHPIASAPLPLIAAGLLADPLTALARLSAARALIAAGRQIAVVHLPVNILTTGAAHLIGVSRLIAATVHQIVIALIPAIVLLIVRAAHPHAAKAGVLNMCVRNTRMMSARAPATGVMSSVQARILLGPQGVIDPQHLEAARVGLQAGLGAPLHALHGVLPEIHRVGPPQGLLDAPLARGGRMLHAPLPAAHGESREIANKLAHPWVRKTGAQLRRFLSVQLQLIR